MVQKMYLAIVEEGNRLERSGYVGPTVGQMQRAPATSGRKQKQREATEAEDDELVLTKYTTLARCQEQFALLALQPVTGQARSDALRIYLHLGLLVVCTGTCHTAGLCARDLLQHE